MGVRPRRIGHFGLIAVDMERVAAFYREVLRMDESDRMDFPDTSPFAEAIWLRCNTDHHVISIFRLRDPPPHWETGRAAAPGLHHIAFELDTFEQLRDAARYARENGVPIDGMRTGGPGTQLRLYLLDPEGNVVELYWGIDQIGWDGRSRVYPPIEDVDLETLDVEAWLASKADSGATAR
jgi:catechol-2,3-dioxygenase